MHIDPTVYTGRPSDQRIPQEEAIYHKLEELSIPFTRVDHDHADTMEDCLRIESVLGGQNLQKPVSVQPPADGVLSADDAGGQALQDPSICPPSWGAPGCPSPTPGTWRSICTPSRAPSPALELLFDAQGKVQLVIDRPLLADDTISGHPGISTSTLRMRREDLLNYVEAVGHSPIYVDLPDPRETGEA